MWILKLRVDSRTQFLGKMALKHEVSMTGYMLNHYKDQHWIYSTSCGFLFGDEDHKRALVQDLKRQPEFVQLEMKDDFAIGITRQPLLAEPLYDHRIIWIEPTIINPKIGRNIWHMASFDRKILERVSAIAVKHFGGEIIKFKKEKITNISIMKILPNITKKQKRALEIAINEGYYTYPKSVKLETLAKSMGVSYSTYQAHLKKAEGKILPAVYQEL